jgi:hypothetical protein
MLLSWCDVLFQLGLLLQDFKVLLLACLMSPIVTNVTKPMVMAKDVYQTVCCHHYCCLSMNKASCG